MFVGSQQPVIFFCRKNIEFNKSMSLANKKKLLLPSHIACEMAVCCNSHNSSN